MSREKKEKKREGESVREDVVRDVLWRFLRHILYRRDSLNRMRLRRVAKRMDDTRVSKRIGYEDCGTDSSPSAPANPRRGHSNDENLAPRRISSFPPATTHLNSPPQTPHNNTHIPPLYPSSSPSHQPSPLFLSSPSPPPQSERVVYVLVFLCLCGGELRVSGAEGEKKEE